MKISVIQMDIHIGDPDRNYLSAGRLITQAAENDPDVIILPEMWNTGYSLENIRDIADMDGVRTEKEIGSLARKYGINIVAGSVSNISGDRIHNTLLVFDRSGQRIAEYNKIHLFRLMDEHKYLDGGNSQSVFELDGHLCGGIICYDLRFPELTRSLALKGIEILFVPAQWPRPRLEHWRVLSTARAIENQIFVTACNRVGSVGNTRFFGYSRIVDPWGNTAGELIHEKEDIFSVEVDLSQVAKVRETIPVFGDRKPEFYSL